MLRTIFFLNCFSWQYLHLILFTIDSLCTHELSRDDALLSVNQLRTIKIAIEVVVNLGIKRCLLSGMRPVGDEKGGMKFFIPNEHLSMYEVSRKN